ncbi:MAG TPA: fumarate reductase subunit FrdD [Thermoplasmata archaeon]|nr:fumarate reductase subunit FrdD [Thermoplasmata archaeon]
MRNTRVDAIDKVTPMTWGLFSLGGFIVALLLPVFIVMNGLAYSFGFASFDTVDYDATLTWIGNPLAKIFIVVLVGGSLFHAMHRIKYILYDFGAHRHKAVLEPLVYGIAAVGTIAALFLAFSFP